MNNGVCDTEILDNFDCLYDYPDCENELKKLEECTFATQQSYLSCELAAEMYHRYPSCKSIQLCCPNGINNLTTNGICDQNIKHKMNCLYDLPDCKEEHLASETCPFLDLFDQLSCEAALTIMADFPACNKVRICQCSKPQLLDNGICDEEIQDEIQCHYDNADCGNAAKMAEMCDFAGFLSQTNCLWAPKLLKQFPYCSQKLTFCKREKPVVLTKKPEASTIESDSEDQETTTEEMVTSPPAPANRSTLGTLAPTTTPLEVNPLYPFCPVSWRVNDSICHYNARLNPFCHYDEYDCCQEDESN